MFGGRIKGTHVPRLALAVIALTLFFVALGFKLIKTPIDFTQPGWAIVMVGFLLLGILMLLTSWVIGLDTRAEIYITLFMLILHVCFDAFIFVQVFILQRDIPVFLVQAVVQAYWIAGLLDVVLMYWAHNWQRTASTYVSPEQENAVLKQQMALMAAALEHQDKMHTAMLEEAQRKQEASTQQAQKLLEAANKVYQATCEGCGRDFAGKTQDLANKGLYGHMPHCKGAATHAPTNGHKQGIPELQEHN